MSEDPNEPKHKMVNGELVALSKEEIAEILKQRAAAKLDEVREEADDRRQDRRQDRREDRQEKRDAKR